MKLTSSAFVHGAGIPTEFTCEGRDAAPALAWTGVPAGTKSLVLIVDDPDAPDPKAPQRTWVHWVLYDIAPEVSGIAAGATPAGAHDGVNDWKRTGWGGPCPPIGRHRYFFKLYALDRVLGNMGQVSKQQVERAMTGHVLAEAELMGTYEKQAR